MGQDDLKLCEPIGTTGYSQYREFWVPLIGNLGETEIEFNMNQQ
jgi:hypothetical protein